MDYTKNSGAKNWRPHVANLVYWPVFVLVILGISIPVMWYISVRSCEDTVGVAVLTCNQPTPSRTKVQQTFRV